MSLRKLKTNLIVGCRFQEPSETPLWSGASEELSVPGHLDGEKEEGGGGGTRREAPINIGIWVKGLFGGHFWETFFQNILASYKSYVGSVSVMNRIPDKH